MCLEKSKDSMLPTTLSFSAILTKALNIPIQRGEAGLSSAGLAAQRGELFTPQGGKDIISALTGKRQSQFGDIVRTTGFGGRLNEQIESVTGLLTLLGAGNVATTGKIAPGLAGKTAGQIGKEAVGEVKGIGQTISKGAKAVWEKRPRIMGRDYTITRAQTLAKDLKDLRLGYGSLKEDMLSKVGNIKTDQTKLVSALDKLPDNAINKMSETIYDFKDSSISNIDKIREAIGDILSSKDWIEATKTNKATLKHVFNELGNLMKETHPDVSSSFDAYSGFMKEIYRPAEKVLFRSGRVVEKPLRGALKSRTERTTQQAFENLGKSVETSKQALKDIGKFTGRQQIKTVAKRIGAGYVGYELLKNLIGRRTSR